MKIGFYCSGKATRLTKLLTIVKESEIFSDFVQKIQFIYVDNILDLPLDYLCKELNLRLVRRNLLEIEKKNKGEVVTQDLSQLMAAHSCDYLFIFGSQIIKEPLLSQYEYRIINFHPSLLPAFPGKNAIDKAIEQGTFLTGNTAHFIDSGIDTGPVIMYNICLLDEWEDYDSILDKQIPMMLQIAKWFEDKRVKVDQRKVRILNGDYSLGEYIPNLEFPINLIKVSQ